MTEVLKGRRSPLFDSYTRGEIGLELEGFKDIIGHSECMKATLLEMQVVARFTDVPLLLLGPPGVGKTRLAELIHELSGVEKKNSSLSIVEPLATSSL